MINLGASSIGEDLDLMATSGQPLQQPGTVTTTPSAPTPTGTVGFTPETTAELAKIAPESSGNDYLGRIRGLLGMVGGSIDQVPGLKEALMGIVPAAALGGTVGAVNTVAGGIPGISEALTGSSTGLNPFASTTYGNLGAQLPGITEGLQNVGSSQQLTDLLAAQGQALPGLGRLTTPQELQAEQIKAALINQQFGGPTDTTSKQGELIAALQARAEGRGGPSLAELQLKQAQQAALNQQWAMAASATGQNAALAQRQIAQQAAVSGQNMARQGALLRAQEQQAAQNQLMQALSGVRGQELQGSQLQAQIAMQNAQQQQAADLANQQAALEAGQFNINKALQAEQANIGIAQSEQQMQEARNQALMDALANQQNLELAKQKAIQDAELRNAALQQEASLKEAELNAQAEAKKQEMIGNILSTGGSVLAGGL